MNRAAAWWVRFAATLGAALIGGTGVFADDADSVCKTLNAAVDKWREALVFQCHYTYCQGAAFTKQAALDCKFDANVAKHAPGDSATGVFSKMGKKIRFSVDYGGPPLSTKDDPNVVMYVSSDQVLMNGLQLLYWPRYGNVGGRAVIQAYSESGSEHATVIRLLTPFSLNPFGSFGCDSPQDTIEKSIKRTDPQHITLVMTLKTRTGANRTRQVTFWNAVSPPVIEKIEGVSDDGGRHIEYVTIASNFVQCGGGMMARDVQSVSGPSVPLNKKTPLWIGGRWTSEDLGARAPTDDDFVVTTPPSVRVDGVKNPPPRGTERRLNLADYSVNDLDDGLLPVF